MQEEPQNQEQKEDLTSSVVRSTAFMTIATMASRVTGLIRTWAMAFALGNTLMTSAYQVANNLPNVIFELVAGGLLSAAFLPVLMLERERHGEAGFNRYGSNIMNICLVVLGALSLLAIVFAKPIIFTQTFTIDQQADVSRYALRFFQIFALQIVFYGLGGVITGILNSRRSYFLTSIAPALNNVFVIASFFAYIPLSQIDPDLALIVLAVGTTMGVAAQFLIQIPALRKTGYKWEPVIDFKDPSIMETVKIAVPTLIFIVGNLIAFSCRNAFSLVGGDEGPSTLNYAWMWFQLPYGVVAVSLSRAMFTEMSDVSSKEDWASLRSYVNRGIRGTLFLIIPLAGMVFVMSTSLIQIFQAGAFNQDDVYTVSAILRLWVVGLPLYSILMYLYNTFASIRRFMAFALLNCVMVALQVLLYWLLCQPNVLVLSGVPVSDCIYYLVGSVAGLLLLRHYVGSVDARSIIWLGARSLLATLVGCAAVAAFLAVVPLQPSIGAALLQIVIGGILGLVVIFGICKLMRIEEMRIVDGILARFKR
ncbi:MAG: murein biosynthesis integral membrane protein MurJ [Eggerthellaceae bacterium]|nr:murein biosynthesis integral membrane protein MurJ [Eggerthellaceae bacterium]